MRSNILTECKRDWLNPEDHEDTGHIKVYYGIEKSDEKPERSKRYYYPSFDCNLDVADCSRKVSLTFCVYGCASSDPQKDRDNMLKELCNRKKKVQIMKEHLSTIEKGLESYEELLRSTILEVEKITHDDAENTDE